MFLCTVKSKVTYNKNPLRVTSLKVMLPILNVINIVSISKFVTSKAIIGTVAVSYKDLKFEQPFFSHLS